MEWRDDGLILGTRKHGETSVIVEAMTRAHGRHFGLVRGGRSRRMQPLLQPGNHAEFVWRARLDEHLGTFSVEPVTLRTARLMAKFHERYDLWLTPTLGDLPLRLGTIDVDETDVQKAFEPLLGYVPFTAMQNATGQPAINLPLSWSESRLPIGVQFVARSGDEMILLKLAAELEEASPWIGRKPPLIERH
jgi:Asp-tRNA(Asn)/Glu-tRNA(Gln) amidotransferase A subunit family amidase